MAVQVAIRYRKDQANPDYRVELDFVNEREGTRKKIGEVVRARTKAEAQAFAQAIVREGLARRVKTLRTWPKLSHASWIGDAGPTFSEGDEAEKEVAVAAPTRGAGGRFAKRT